jgi:hypothetical protein
MHGQDANLPGGETVKQLVGKPPDKSSMNAVANVREKSGILENQVNRLCDGLGKVVAEIGGDVVIPRAGSIGLLICCRMDKESGGHRRVSSDFFTSSQGIPRTAPDSMSASRRCSSAPGSAVSGTARASSSLASPATSSTRWPNRAKSPDDSCEMQ